MIKDLHKTARMRKHCLDVGNLHSLGVLLLSEFLVLLSSSFLLFSQLISLNLFSLHSVDSFNQDSLVLVLVTLGGKVEVMMAIKRGYFLLALINSSYYICLSIFFWALYFLSNLLKTLCLLIQRTFWGVLASLVPFLLPGPVCLPIHPLFSHKRRRF